VKYQQSEVFSIPVPDGTPALGRVILKMRGGNILVAVYPENSEIVDSADLERLSTPQPVFTIETMDLFIKNGRWTVLGKWVPVVESSIPVYKTQFEPGGPFFEQRIENGDGTLMNHVLRWRRGRHLRRDRPPPHPHSRP
jgi:hypothetical protein